MKIRTIVTRKSPNLECGLFAYLLTMSWVRQCLGVTRGDLKWAFVSTFQGYLGNVPRGEGIRSFNTGGGPWDQHGHPDNANGCKVCSLQLVQRSYDFLRRRPWLREVFALVCENDKSGAWISHHQHHLRELMSGLAVSRAHEPQLVLDWLALAFAGIFTRIKAGKVTTKNAFNPEELILGVQTCAPDRLQWFRDLLNESVTTLNKEWQRARSAVGSAVSAGTVAEVFVPAVNGLVGVVSVSCDSYKTGSAARRAGIPFCIQWSKDGHCQVHGGIIFATQKAEEDAVSGSDMVGVDPEIADTADLSPHRITARLKLDVRPIAEALRREEAKLTGVTVAGDWQRLTYVHDTNGRVVPWFVPEFASSVFNGTLSSDDVPVTRLSKTRVLELVREALPLCQLLPDSDPLPAGKVVFGTIQPKKANPTKAAPDNVANVVDFGSVAAAFDRKARSGRLQPDGSAMAPNTDGWVIVEPIMHHGR